MKVRSLAGGARTARPTKAQIDYFQRDVLRGVSLADTIIQTGLIDMPQCAARHKEYV